MRRAALLLLALGRAALAQGAPLAVELMLPPVEVDAEGDRNVFATPFDYRDGRLFTVHVEPAAASGRAGMNLRTVVRKGVRQADGGWTWEAVVLEDRTLLDPWHTQASIALDRDGYVHVAYNMHNMPWQYSVSRRPLDIAAFEFRGEALPEGAREAVRFANRTPFPGAGTAAIPGNQVSYPMFFADRRGELYLSYRFALKPAQAWQRRAFAGAIARYDTATRRWSQIGGELRVAPTDARPAAGGEAVRYRPFAFEDGYSVYLITLAFDAANGMHVFWNWRPGGAGMDTLRPSYAYSPDGRDFFDGGGRRYALPVGYAQAAPIAAQDGAARYYAPKSAAVLPSGEAVVVLHPLEGGRQIRRWRKDAGAWGAPEPAPAGTSEIVVDGQGRLWAFASGLRVFRRDTPDAPWTEVGRIGEDLCHPRARYIAGESRFVVHAKRCDGARATIVSFRG